MHLLGEWMTDNAKLFRYAGELQCMREEAKRILLSGDSSVFLAPLFRTLYPQSTIIAASDDASVFEEVASEVPDIVRGIIPFSKGVYENIDIAVSVLSIETLETRELTQYLYSLHDSLTEGGNLYLSFPSTDTFVYSPMKEEKAWWDESRSILMKRYQGDDVIRALSMIGFGIKAAERDNLPDIGTVISIHAERK